MEGQIDVTEIVTLDHVLTFDGAGYTTYDVVIEGRSLGCQYRCSTKSRPGSVIQLK